MWMSGYLSAHIRLLVFLISKSGPCTSLCCDGRFLLCKCHHGPLPVSPLSAPCCPLWHLWDPPCPFSDKELWWLQSFTCSLSFTCAHTHKQEHRRNSGNVYRQRHTHYHVRWQMEQIFFLVIHWTNALYIHYYVITDTTTTTTVLCYLKSLTPITYLLESLLYSATDIFMTSISTWFSMKHCCCHIM